MPDHVHMYLRTRGVRHLSRIIAGLKVSITRSIRGMNVRWQRGYFERIIRGDIAPGNVVRYVLLNPVRAGLVRSPEEYAYMGVVDRYV